MYESIKLEFVGHAAIVTLNRPESLNAFTYPMIDEFGYAVQEAEGLENVTGIVVTGAGRGFCAGVDMNTLNQLQQDGKGSQSDTIKVSPGDKTMGDNFGPGLTYLLSVRKPIIAAVNGACVGLGMSLSLFCDLRFASENAKFLTSFSPRGLVAEHGQSWILPRIVHPSRALDLLWSSRKVDAAEAFQIGLVDRVFKPERLIEESINYIEHLANTTAPMSLMAMKRQVYRHLNMQLGEAMQETSHLMEESMVRGDFKEGIASFIEKRPPKFKKISLK
ncbi:enoyl-CoA hydratase-related protein [Desulfatitalea tepidiphila]|uniref:enoyl-CoA hydratase-related protein n=1 Tax=Desulfatitalea tepidiphila TaxID=1185843 RepID=UPI0006B5DEED|nr:enoyl-CoA hydratase-related protein [Desulfatitalea tepidiphila]